jgi:hypothetical protein
MWVWWFLRLPQDGLWVALLFGFCLWFFVCFGVADVFFCHMLHGNRGMWMWRHAPNQILFALLYLKEKLGAPAILPYLRVLLFL